MSVSRSSRRSWSGPALRSSRHCQRLRPPWTDLADPTGEICGVAGLRISPWNGGRVHLTIPGRAGEVVLANLPATTWKAALALWEQDFDDISLTRQFWTTHPRAATAGEHAFNARWKDPSGSEGRAWLASGLLRRTPLFAAADAPAHTEA